MIYFVCPQCHSVFHVQDKMAGRKAKCPKCKAEFIVPAACPPVKASFPSAVPEETYKLAKEPSAPRGGLDESMSLPPSPLSPVVPATPLRKQRCADNRSQTISRIVFCFLVVCVAIGLIIMVTIVAARFLPDLKNLTKQTASAGDGSPEAARAYLTSAVEKWMIGKPEKDLLTAKTFMAEPPIGFEIKSLLRVKTTLLNFSNPKTEPTKSYDDYPAYLVNTVLDFKSKGGTPIKHVIRYTVVWDKAEKKWYVHADISD